MCRLKVRRGEALLKFLRRITHMNALPPPLAGGKAVFENVAMLVTRLSWCIWRRCASRSFGDKKTTSIFIVHANGRKLYPHAQASLKF